MVAVAPKLPASMYEWADAVRIESTPTSEPVTTLVISAYDAESNECTLPKLRRISIPYDDENPDHVLLNETLLKLVTEALQAETA